MIPYFTEKFGNAASRTHSYGWISEEAVQHARSQAAGILGATAEELIFTSGSTESINLAMKGVYHSYRSKGNHLVTLATEHKATLDTCAQLENEGARITYLPVQPDGIVDLELIRNAILPETILVTVMLANNETGVLQDIHAISNIVHERETIMMSDITQACGKIRVDVNELGIDLACMSAHKLYGPKGSGVLYVRRKNPRVRLEAQIHGGGHEHGLRSGTLNVPGIVGLGAACERAADLLWDDADRISSLRTRLEQFLTGECGAIVNGNFRNRLPNTSNVSFPGLRADDLIGRWKNDLAVSSGSACSSALPEPSHVLIAMGLTSDAARSSVRFSLGRFTTIEEIDFACERIRKALTEV